MLTFEIRGDDFTATVAETFQCCHPFKTQRGHNWGRLEHLPALHETKHTSEKCWNALLFQLHKLQAPFQVSVAGLKQDFIAARSLLASMTYGFTA
jgi:hypothetical protein